jgi:hypothetical protein
MYMIKKDYLQPAIEVLKADTEAQILAGSLTDVSTDLGEGDELILPSGDDPTTGILWGDAM